MSGALTLRDKSHPSISDYRAKSGMWITPGLLVMQRFIHILDRIEKQLPCSLLRFTFKPVAACLPLSVGTNQRKRESYWPCCQTAFTVMPSPHVLPTLSTRRNSFPRSIAAAASQSSSSVLTQSGTGTVRTWLPLPTRSTMAQCSSRCWR